MIEIKFDSTNETIMVEYLKQLFKDNPILLQNIIEPKVGAIVEGMINEMISSKALEKAIASSIEAQVNKIDMGSENDKAITSEIEKCNVERMVEDEIIDTVLNQSRQMNIPNTITKAIDEKVNEEINNVDVATHATEKINEWLKHLPRPECPIQEIKPDTVESKSSVEVVVLSPQEDIEALVFLLTLFKKGHRITIHSINGVEQF
jgi:hypothetical protein